MYSDFSPISSQHWSLVKGLHAWCIHSIDPCDTPTLQLNIHVHVYLRSKKAYYGAGMLPAIHNSRIAFYMYERTHLSPSIRLNTVQKAFQLCHKKIWIGVTPRALQNLEQNLSLTMASSRYKLESEVNSFELVLPTPAWITLVKAYAMWLWNHTRLRNATASESQALKTT